MKRCKFIRQTSGSVMFASLLPEKVQTDLPAAVKAIRDDGLEVPMITTAITDPDDPVTSDILETAGNLAH